MAWKLLRTAFCFLLLAFLLLSCTTPVTQPAQSTQASLYLYRFDPPAFVHLSADFQPGNEIPFPVPLSCTLFDVFPAPVGRFLLVELSCPNGQTVLFLDTDTGSTSQPVTDADSHFLAWSGDGKSVYLKVDSLGDARVVRAYTGGKIQKMNLTGWTYDLATNPLLDDFVFTFSQGLGYGSELTLSQQQGREQQQLYVDRYHYLSFAQYSPDGQQIAFIKIPDTQTPFTVGELWVMDADGSDSRKLADVDAGHGYAADWSPDGKWIAFVKRENVEDRNADQAAESLISNIYRVNVGSGEQAQITFLKDGRAETPHWSPDGNTLAFNTVLDGRMEVQIADIASGEIRSLMPAPGCCPAWMRK